MRTATRRLLVLAAVLASAPAGAAEAGARPAIVGGQPASKPYPYAALVEVGNADGSRYSCGGVLVAARYVLTAGHCLDASPQAIGVTVGSARVDHDPSTPAEHRAAGWVQDPRYALLAGFEPVEDAAVVTLDRPASETPVRLPRPSDAALWATGARATAVGWGLCGPSERPVCGYDLEPEDLREVVLPVQPDTSCSVNFNYRPSAMLCAGGEPGRDTCSGDSGGPLTVDDGAGQPVLAGLTSFGSGLCGDGSAAVYTRVGGPDVNAWLRSVVPQVELEAGSSAPAPGDAVTFRATASRPGGSGPFGGYDAIDWDLDGDGAFGEAAGQTSVQRVMADGVNTVSARATSTAGDAETRTLRVRTVERALISFAQPAVSVTEGDVATLTLRHAGVGAGTVTVTPSPAAARLRGDVRSTSPQTVAFGAGDQSATVAFATAEDHVPERSESFRVTLGDFTGALAPGEPATATVTVLDDDPAVGVRAASRARRGRLALALTADRGGRWTVAATRAGRRAARGARARVARAGTRRLSLRLTARMRRALAGGRRVRLHVRATFVPSAGETVTLRRTVALRRAR